MTGPEFVADATNTTPTCDPAKLREDQGSAWGRDRVHELETMGIKVLRVTDNDFPEQLGRSLAETQRRRVDELLSVLGMVAYAASVGQLVQLAHRLGDAVGRRVRSNVNIPGLGLEVLSGYSSELGSGRGQIIQLAIERKFTAAQMVGYVRRWGLDGAVTQARRDLKTPRDGVSPGDREQNATPGAGAVPPAHDENNPADDRDDSDPADTHIGDDPPPPVNRRRPVREAAGLADLPEDRISESDSDGSRLKLTASTEVLSGLSDLVDGQHVLRFIVDKRGNEVVLELAEIETGSQMGAE